MRAYLANRTGSTLALFTVLTLSLVFGIALTTVAVAQQPTLKIGFADASKIIELAPQAEQARQLLEEEFGPRDQGLVDAQRQLRELEDKLSNEALTIDDDERRSLEQQIRVQRRDLDRSRREFKEDFNIRRNDELRKLQRLVYDTIVAMAKEQSFDLIVNDGAVIFAGPQVDITEQVLARLSAEDD